jgi:2-aminoadipate transaminase
MIKFSQRMEYVNLVSEVGEMFKAAANPNIISFAGGLPAPEAFPVAEIATITTQVLEEMGAQALQYSTPEGFPQLRQQILRRECQNFVKPVELSQIIITNGSQQGLDLAGKLFLDEGDVVLCESPTYLAALQAFRSYGAHFVEIPTDEEGILIEELKKLLVQYPQTKMIYVIPNFQNPTGRTWSLARRQQFISLLTEWEIPVVEDNPYGALCFEGEVLPSLKEMDEKGFIIQLGTFSKTYCPGYRIGWIIASPELAQRFVALKENSDLHTSSINQLCVSRYLDKFSLDDDIKRIAQFYRGRRDVMLAAMEQEFPAGVTWTHPKGGLFIWVTLPEALDAKELLNKCLEHEVAFVPGGPFFPAGSHRNNMRLNFSNMPEDRIREGIHRIAKVLKEEIATLARAERPCTAAQS